MQWKLTHKQHHECIENEGGKALSYNPNLGIQIIEQNGFAFKDLNNNGILDPYEDWRLPLTERVRDFTNRFTLWQEGDCLYYRKGKIKMSQDFYELIELSRLQNLIIDQIQIDQEDLLFLEENYMLALLILMFDNDYDTGKEDCLLSLIIQSMDLGLLENIIFSITEALKKFMNHSRLYHLQKQVAR